eukprot:Gb_18585 [translate_table: standard]
MSSRIDAVYRRSQTVWEVYTIFRRCIYLRKPRLCRKARSIFQGGSQTDALGWLLSVWSKLTNAIACIGIQGIDANVRRYVNRHHQKYFCDMHARLRRPTHMRCRIDSNRHTSVFHTPSILHNPTMTNFETDVGGMEELFASDDITLWRPTELATVVAGNPDRPVDGVNTIGILLTLSKTNTVAGYPGVSVEDEGRNPDYISLACLETRQRFRCGGVLDGHILRQCQAAQVRHETLAIQSCNNDKRMIEVKYKSKKKTFTPEEISSMILLKMKKIAEAYPNPDVKNTAVTVPAYRNDSHRQHSNLSKKTFGKQAEIARLQSNILNNHYKNDKIKAQLYRQIYDSINAESDTELDEDCSYKGKTEKSETLKTTEKLEKLEKPRRTPGGRFSLCDFSNAKVEHDWKATQANSKTDKAFSSIRLPKGDKPIANGKLEKCMNVRPSNGDKLGRRSTIPLGDITNLKKRAAEKNLIVMNLIKALSLPS